MADDDVSFDVRARLGVGGFGEVSLAVMKRRGREEYVAPKRIRSDLLDQQGYLLQFEREAKICARLDHPHVVRQVAFGHDDQGPYLALEYVNGKPASAIDGEYDRRGEAMPLQVALAISRDAARGLNYAHQLALGDDRGAAGGVSAAWLSADPDPTVAQPLPRPPEVEQPDLPNPIRLGATREDAEQALTTMHVRAQMGPKQALNQVDVEVRSEPKGAIVQLDGIKQASRTPMTLKGLRPGQLYQVDVAAPGFYAWSEKVIADGKPVDVKLKPLAVEK